MKTKKKTSRSVRNNLMAPIICIGIACSLSNCNLINDNPNLTSVQVQITFIITCSQDTRDGVIPDPGRTIYFASAVHKNNDGITKPEDPQNYFSANANGDGEIYYTMFIRMTEEDYISFYWGRTSGDWKEIRHYYWNDIQGLDIDDRSQAYVLDPIIRESRF